MPQSLSPLCIHVFEAREHPHAHVCVFVFGKQMPEKGDLCKIVY